MYIFIGYFFRKQQVNLNIVNLTSIFAQNVVDNVSDGISPLAVSITQIIKRFSLTDKDICLLEGGTAMFSASNWTDIETMSFNIVIYR